MPQPQFSIEARDGAARAGVLALEHGEVRTPAFVPLASNASVRGLAADEVAELGFEMVLGNTFHLFVRPGPDRIRAMGGLHEFMGWRRPIITDSGGFQVFSMGHGSVADEVKRSRGRSSPESRAAPRDPLAPAPRASPESQAAAGASPAPGPCSSPEGRVLSIEEEGVAFRSYLDGSELFMGPETSMEVQAALGADIVLAFDECTPFHADRAYTRRSMERTHRWLERCVAWRAEHGGPDQILYGIVQGGVHEDLRAESAAFVAGATPGGVAVGGSLGREKETMREVIRWSLGPVPEGAPRHLLGIGDVDDILDAVAAGIDTFDCATPTRLARHGTALVLEPGRRFRLDLKKSAWRESREPIERGCPCPACRRHTRAYLHYLARAGELTAARLLTLHNLTFMARLMGGIRSAIRAGRYGAHAQRLLSGEGPLEGPRETPPGAGGG